MTRAHLQRTARNLAMYCAREGGLPYAIIAAAHGLSVSRVKAIVKDLKDNHEARKTALVGILIALEEQALRATRPPKNRTRRAATL